MSFAKDSTKTLYLVLATLIMFSLIWTAGCKKEDPAVRFERYSKAADLAIEQGKLEEARIQLINATEAKPDHAESYFKLADVYAKLKTFDQAVINYQTALNLKPDYRDARLRLAALMLLAQQYELAESHIRKLLEANPDDTDGMLLNANFERVKGNLQKSREILNQILKVKPDNVTALASLADVEMAEGNLQKAEEIFSQVIKLEPANSPIRLALSDLYIRQGRMDDAQNVIENLVNKEPDNSGLRYYFGEFLLGRGFSDKALEQYKQTLSESPERHDARDRLYDMYLTRGQVEDAKQLTAELIAKKPNDAGVAYFKGRNDELEGRSKEALEKYLGALEGLKNFAPVFRRAGLLELQKGDRQVALEHLNQAIAISSTDVGARLALARDAFLRQDFGLAQEHVLRVLERFPRQLAANILRADIALLQGDVELPRKIYELLINAYPDSAMGYFKMALLEEKRNEMDKAVDWYRKGLAFDRGVFLPAKRFAQILMVKQGLTVAEKEISQLLESSKNSKPEYEVILASLILSRQPRTEGNINEARKYFTSAIEQRQDFLPAYFAMAQLDNSMGDRANAAENYKKLLEREPKHVPTRMLLALTLESSQKWNEAAEQYREILKVSPRFAPAANNLAWLMAENLSGDLHEALKLALVAKEQLPNEPAVADTVGWIYHRQGSSNAALSYLQEAYEAQKSPALRERQNPEILYHFGVVKLAVGDKDGGRAVLNEALAAAGEGNPIKVRIQEALNK